MGFFSWRCAECGRSIMNMYVDSAEGPAVRAIHKDGRVVRGVYDGYGRIETDADSEPYAEGKTVELVDGDWNVAYVESDETSRAKLVHAQCYTGQSFDELRHNERCPNQGYFDFTDVEPYED